MCLQIARFLCNYRLASHGRHISASDLGSCQNMKTADCCTHMLVHMPRETHLAGFEAQPSYCICTLYMPFAMATSLGLLQAESVLRLPAEQDSRISTLAQVTAAIATDRNWLTSPCHMNNGIAHAICPMTALKLPCHDTNWLAHVHYWCRATAQPVCVSCL